MKRHTLTILASLLFLTGSASFAFADDGQCTTDADCAIAQKCVEVPSGCPPPCHPDDDNCEATECNPGKSSICQPAGPDDREPPASCTMNSDCDAGLICLARTSTSCSGSGGGSTMPCPAGEDCETNDEPPAQEQCETTTKSYCVPPYVAPCTDDASCGAPGFTCEVSSTDCACPPSEGPDSSPCECSEPEEGDGYCELENISCDSDEECENDYLCHRISSPAPDSSCTFDTQTGIEECEDPNEGNNYPNIGRCAPADYPYWIGGTSQDTGDGTKGETTEGGGDNDNTDGEHNNSNTPKPGAPADDDSDKEGLDLTDDTKTSDDGCHIASLNTGKTSTTAILLAGAAAFFTFRRRKN